MCSLSPIQHHDLSYDLNLLSLSHHWKSCVSNHQWFNSHTFEQTSSVREHVYGLETTSFVALVHLIQPISKHASQQIQQCQTTIYIFQSKVVLLSKMQFQVDLQYQEWPTPLLSICKKVWTPPSLSLNLAPYILLWRSSRRLAHAQWSNNFASWNTASKLHQSLVFMFSRQREHMATNNFTTCTSHIMNQGYTMHKKSCDILNYIMHTKMSLLEEWQWTTALTTSIFPILEILNLFYFLISHLCNWLFELLHWSLHHFVVLFELTDNGNQSWVCVQYTQFCS